MTKQTTITATCIHACTYVRTYVGHVTVCRYVRIYVYIYIQLSAGLSLIYAVTCAMLYMLCCVLRVVMGLGFRAEGSGNSLNTNHFSF